MKTFLTTALFAIFAALLLTAIIDQNNKAPRTFMIAQKYSKLECASFLCITKNTNYYFVTDDGKLYHTDSETIYDRLAIAQSHTALIIPRNGYITEVVEPGFTSPTLQDALARYFPMNEWTVGKYKLNVPAFSPVMIAYLFSLVLFVGSRFIRREGRL